MNTIFRYARINLALFKNSWIRDAQIPGYIVSNILWRVFDLIFSIIFFNILFANSPELGGWNYWQVMFLYAFARTIIITHGAWTKRGVQSMATDLIRRGEFDFYLAKPVDPMIMVSIKSPRIYNLLNLLFMIPLTVYAAVKSGVPIGAENIIWFFILAVLGLFLYYFLELITVIPSFWFVRLWALSDVINQLGNFMRYPAEIYSNGIRLILLVIIPIVAISYIPARTLFYPPEAKYILMMFAITIVFGVLTRYFWLIGQKSYNSASS